MSRKSSRMLTVTLSTDTPLRQGLAESLDTSLAALEMLWRDADNLYLLQATVEAMYRSLFGTLGLASLRSSRKTATKPHTNGRAKAMTAIASTKPRASWIKRDYLAAQLRAGISTRSSPPRAKPARTGKKSTARSRSQPQGLIKKKYRRDRHSV